MELVRRPENGNALIILYESDLTVRAVVDPACYFQRVCGVCELGHSITRRRNREGATG